MWIKIRSLTWCKAAGFCAALAVALFVSAAYAQPTETRFTVVNSSPTSWVARGYSNYTVTPDLDWVFTAGRNFDNGVSMNLSGPPPQGTTVTNWFLNFAAPFGAEITPGFYPDFQRWPFQNPDRPGLEFGSTGRLDNRASGFFEVFEATYDSQGEVLSFSVDFTHYGEENPNNWAIVEVRYNAIPEPGAAALVVLGLPFLLRRRRNQTEYRHAHAATD